MNKVYEIIKKKVVENMTGTNTYKYLLCAHDLICNHSDKQVLL